MSSTNAMWQFFNRFQYASSNALILNGLTAGTTYELRLYVRPWTVNGTRWITFTYNDGTADKSFHFNEDGNNSSDDFIALRYTPTGSTFKLTWAADASKDGFHLYTFSNEEVADYVRVVNTGADTTFSGAITGNGELRKTGAGTWTLTGAGTLSDQTTTVSPSILAFAQNHLPS